MGVAATVSVAGIQTGRNFRLKTCVGVARNVALTVSNRGRLNIMAAAMKKLQKSAAMKKKAAMKTKAKTMMKKTVTKKAKNTVKIYGKRGWLPPSWVTLDLSPRTCKSIIIMAMKATAAAVKAMKAMKAMK